MVSLGGSNKIDLVGVTFIIIAGVIGSANVRK